MPTSGARCATSTSSTSTRAAELVIPVELTGGASRGGVVARRIPVLALGFRPFYLLAGLLATAWVPYWVGVLLRQWPAPTYFGPIAWHAHEMIFGFTMAVMVGFLMTAVRNWTGQPTPTGLGLGALALLWIAGRGVILAAHALPGWLVAATDVAFLPAVAVLLLVPICRVRNRRNLAFPLILLALAGANLVMHLHAQGVLASGTGMALRFALDAIMLVMVIMAGRVVPAFTANALPGVGVRRAGWIDRIAVALVVATLVADLLPLRIDVVGWITLAAALANAARMVGWRSVATWRSPILWILHAGYAWIVITLVLKGLAAVAGWVPGSLAVHALTVGAIGSLTLAMMTRSALGHTGRPLVAGPGTVAAYVLVNAAALVRVFGPIGWPGLYMPELMVSGLLWSLAFAAFVVTFWPVLTRPRIDGHPG